MSALRLPGQHRVPEVVRAVPLPAGARRLAWGVTEQGDALVATPGGLVLPGGELLPWWEVEKAVWRPPLLVVTEVAEVEGTGRTRSYPLQSQDRLAEAVRAAVTSSVGWSDRRRLGTGAVRLVGRRIPGRDPLRWQLVFDSPAAAEDPLARAEAQELLDALRRTIG